MTIEEKVWGDTLELFRNNTTSTHYLGIEEGGYCSEHRHAQKRNIFFVIEGELEITEWYGKQVSKTVLTPPSGIFTIPPGVWHMSRALTYVVCVEVYDYMYDGIDIERRVEGGLDSA